MNNLYVFAIGGSGERAMYSLVMALGAGMPIAANRIVPIFVDNDKRSPALDRATNLIKYYRNIPNGGNDPKYGARELVKLMENNKTTFFSTEIDEPISLVIGGDNITTLGEQTSTSIKINDLEKRINEEKNLLFTQDELSMPLSAGFIGHPNIGSVILNSWEFNQESYTNLVNNIGENDGVLVIGSLFGGTGAAGIPLIINKFNETPQRPKIGVVAVLPYFKTEKSKDGDGHGGKWVVNTDEFDIKTRAALMYYDKYMRNLDYLYYVGDGNHLATYKYSIGGDGTGIVGKEPQKNPTHPIEVMAAMSVFDFAQSENTNSVQYKIPVWKYGEDEDKSNKSNLTDIQLPQFRHSLVKFQMLINLFVSDILKECIDNNIPFVKNIGIEKTDITDITTDILGKKESKTNEYWGLNMFIKEWYKWVSELEHRNEKNGNKREMNYFDQETIATEDNFTTLFHTDQGECGVAKKETKKRLLGIRSEEVVMTSEVKNYLEALFDELSKKSGIISKVKQSNKMSFLLWVISSGLDRMINEKCFV